MLGYLGAGVLLGSHLGFGVVENSESITLLTHIGLILLMYILGMEIDVRRLKYTGKSSIVSGVIQVFGCILLGLICIQWLFTTEGKFDAFYISFAASLSSTLIVVKTLSERLELHSLTSRLTIGILLIQDLIAILFLAVQPSLADFQILPAFASLGKVIMLIAFCWFVARYILPAFLRHLSKHTELMSVLSIGWCLGICLMASYLSISLEMGALVAGISLAHLPYKSDIIMKISSLRDFLLTLFFVSLGLQIPAPTAQTMTLALLLVVFVFLSRGITLFPVLHSLRYGNHASIVPTINLSQISEFSLILLSLGVSYGHIREDLLSSFTYALIITVLISSIMIPHAHRIYRKLNPLMEKIGFNDRIDHHGNIPQNTEQETRPKIVILGLHREGSSLLHELSKRHMTEALKEVMILDLNPETLRKLHKMKVKAHYVDLGHPDTLLKFPIEGANLIICTIPDHLLKGVSNLTLLRFCKKNYKARMIVTAETMEAAKEMYKEGADYVFMPRIISAHYLNDIIERLQTSDNEAIKNRALEFLHNREEILP